MTAIQVHNLTVHRGRGVRLRVVLRDVSCAVPASSFTAIVGPNGVGKTTLVRTLLGVEAPASGRVMLGDRDLAGLRGVERARRMAYVPQRSDVTFGYSVGQIVAMGRYALGGDAEHHAYAAMESLAIAHLAYVPFATLSAGQQQRAILARALAQLGAGPEAGGSADLAGKVLLADEPVSAMDPGHALSTLDLLAKLSSRGLAVVCVLHDLNLVLRFATRGLVLAPEPAGGEPDHAEAPGPRERAGRVLAQGPVADVVSPAAMSALFGTTFESVVGSGNSGARGLVATLPGPANVSTPASA